MPCSEGISTHSWAAALPRHATAKAAMRDLAIVGVWGEERRRADGQCKGLNAKCVQLLPRTTFGRRRSLFEFRSCDHDACEDIFNKTLVRTAVRPKIFVRLYASPYKTYYQ